MLAKSCKSGDDITLFISMTMLCGTDSIPWGWAGGGYREWVCLLYMAFDMPLVDRVHE